MSSRDGRSLHVDQDELAGSRHAKIACSQCHAEVNASQVRPCETITQKVDCAPAMPKSASSTRRSTHGQLLGEERSERARRATNATARTESRARQDPASATFPTNVPPSARAATAKAEGGGAVHRRPASDHRALPARASTARGCSKSGLTVTAMCTDCHTAHSVQPRRTPVRASTREIVPATCGRCHHGIEEQFEQQHPLCEDRAVRQAAPGLQRLPQRPHDPPRGRPTGSS